MAESISMVDRMLRWLFFAAFVAIVVTGAIVTMPRYHKYQELVSEHAQLMGRIAEKEKEVQAVREKRKRFHTDREFVEAIARENRRVFPGEIVFIFDK